MQRRVVGSSHADNVRLEKVTLVRVDAKLEKMRTLVLMAVRVGLGKKRSGQALVVYNLAMLTAPLSKVKRMMLLATE